MSEEKSKILENSESSTSGKCVPSPRVSAFSIERLLARTEDTSKRKNSLGYDEAMREGRISVAADSSMSLTDEIETLEDSDVVCSTSPEPEISYGKWIIIF